MQISGLVPVQMGKPQNVRMILTTKSAYYQKNQASHCTEIEELWSESVLVSEPEVNVKDDLETASSSGMSHVPIQISRIQRAEGTLALLHSFPSMFHFHLQIGLYPPSSCVRDVIAKKVSVYTTEMERQTQGQ